MAQALDIKSLAAQSLLSLDFASQFVAALRTLPPVSVDEFYDAFLKKNGIRDKPGKQVVFTPGLMLGALYVLVLLPREIFQNQIPSIPVNNWNRAKWGALSLIVCPPDQHTLDHVLRHVRNAIAHGRLSVAADWTVTFRDGRESDPFEASIQFEGIQPFLDAITCSWLSSNWN